MPEETSNFGNMMDDLSQSALSGGRGDPFEVDIALDGVIGAALEKPLVSSALSTMPMSRITAVNVPRREHR